MSALSTKPVGRLMSPIVTVGKNKPGNTLIFFAP